LDTSRNAVKLVVLSDIHIGERSSNTKLLKETINYVENTKDCYLILNGDIINNAILGSKSDIYEEMLNPREQLKMAIELLEPVKDKIILMSSGNHEYRTNKLTGNDPLDYVATKLGIEKYYADNSWFLILRFGNVKQIPNRKNIYTVYGTHGRSGGTSISSTVKALEKMADVVANADLYIHSHTHKFVNFSRPINIYNATANKIVKKDRMFVNTPSFVEYGGYSEMYGFPPSDTRPIQILIEFKNIKNIMKPFTSVSHIF
jgi:predicted MPP superfamily phosphohydrolase